VDAVSGTPRASAALVFLAGREDGNGGADPKVAIDLSLGLHQPVDERVEPGDHACRTGEDLVTLADERIEESIARREALAQERLGDRALLVT